MGLLKKSMVLSLLVMALAFQNVQAQEKVESSFYFGIGGGYQSNHMSISDLDKNYFPENENQNTGVFDFFLQYEFGKKKQYAVRLEFDWLKRGGSLKNIYNTHYFKDFYKEEGISDINYRLRANYFDIRLPLIYQFNDSRSILRPYVYLAPMISFATGGNISTQVDYLDGSYAGTNLAITNGNLRPAYFGGAIGAGLKYDLNICGHPFYLALEVDYQMGVTNTYSSKEMAGSAVVKDNSFFYTYDITGSRRFSGLEIKGALSIPLSLFTKKKKKNPTPEPISWIEPEPTPVMEESVVVEELPCYSIDDITARISRGEDVHGVTFCSIDDIRFETGKHNLNPSSYVYLDKVADILKQTGVNIEVKGHTDNTGTPEFNNNLSRRRAQEVVKYLRSKGVDKKQVSYTYYGETRPIADNSTTQGRSINRRVEFEIK